jgi:DTW domain-containing protein YfiP
MNEILDLIANKVKAKYGNFCNTKYCQKFKEKNGHCLNSCEGFKEAKTMFELHMLLNEVMHGTKTKEDLNDALAILEAKED